MPLPAVGTLPFSAVASQSVEAIAIDQPRILVVDDEQSVRDSMARSLQSRGYDVSCAGSGEEALETVDRSAGRFDLVISDIVMRGISGIALAEQLRVRDPSVELILISGYPGTHLEAARLVLQPTDLLQKPFTPRQLAARVQEKIRRAITRSPTGCTPPGA